MASVGPGRPPSTDPDDAGAADPGAVRDAETREFRRDDSRGACLLEGELRMRVDVAPQGDEVRLDGGSGVADAALGVVGKHR
jgi:hypothetical protein